MRTRQRVHFILAVFGVVFSSVLFAGESAVLQWQRTVSMSTPVSGVVVKVEAQVGARVDKGQVLLKLDDRARLAHVNALQAKLKSAKNNRDESIREMERTQELYDRTLISEHELQLARIQRDESEAQYQNVLAILSQSEMDLQYSTVRAPFSAWVTQRNVEVGQTIVSELQAEPLVVLVEAGYMVARTQVSGDGLSGLSVGKKAQVIIGKKVYQGEIYHVALSPIVGTTDQYTVDVSFKIGDKTYRAGQPAEVRF